MQSFSDPYQGIKKIKEDTLISDIGLKEEYTMVYSNLIRVSKKEKEKKKTSMYHPKGDRDVMKPCGIDVTR